jgi:hypothetical protein
LEIALNHTTLANSRLRFLFIAAKIWRHASRTGVTYSDHYEEKTTFQRLMSRCETLFRAPLSSSRHRRAAVLIYTGLRASKFMHRLQVRDQKAEQRITSSDDYYGRLIKTTDRDLSTLTIPTFMVWKAGSAIGYPIAQSGLFCA